MPFPWKKKKSSVTRISRIVADLQSPKHGGSLVVQTGFPTSLIDLFVKNRSRFARPKPKKSGRPEDIPDPPPPPPSPAASPPPAIPTLPSLPEVPKPDQSIRAKYNADCDANSGRVNEPGSTVVSGNKIVGVLVRILVVLVLIASVKGLTVGITVSAFALLFLEYAAKRTVSCSRPCAWFQKLRLKKKAEEESEVANFQCKMGELRCDSSRVLDEIEVVEANSEEEESRCPGVVVPELGLVGGDVAWGGSELVDDDDDGDSDGDDSSTGKVVVAEASSLCETCECKASRGRSGNFRFKSKMVKKLLTKKFRGSKKENRKVKMGKEGEVDSGSEVSSTKEENNKSMRMSFEIEEETKNVGKSEDDDVDEGVSCGITGSKETS